MWGAIASVAGPIIGGMIQGDSAQSAADAQGQATDKAIAASQQQYDQTRKDLAPYRAIGAPAAQRLSDLLGLPRGEWQPGMATPAGADSLTQWAQKAGYDLPQGRDWRSDEEANLNPGYQAYLKTVAPAGGGAQPEGFGDLTKKFTLADFWNDPVTQASFQTGLDTGTKALQNQARAGGNLNSGATLKALQRYATDYTGGQAAGSQGRFVGDQTNTYNRLAGVAGMGQNAANMTGTLGANNASTVGGLISAQGNAQGAANIAGGNSIGQAIGGIGNYFNQQQTLDKILKSQQANQASQGLITGSNMYDLP